MISHVEKVDPKELENLPQNSIATRIEAMSKAYGGGFGFLDFWLQKNETETTAALCRFSGELWLLASKTADFEELSSFCGVIAPTVLTDTDTAQRMGLSVCNEFFEVCKHPTEGKNSVENHSLMQIYDLLTEGADGDIEILDKTEWYADLSHRIRHQTAMAAASENAVALAGFVGQETALVTGVATRPSKRGTGEGKAVLEELSKRLFSRTVYAEATEKTLGFYLGCGFFESGRLSRSKT